MTERAQNHRFGSLLGSGAPIAQVYERIEKAARIDVPVLVVGETGTGKELVAGEIHRRSPRASGPFVALNTGTLSRELMLSELFGHVKGAFTGASSDKPGRFAEAAGGTLFLDEVATMDEDVQTALLRVLEQGVCRPLGASRDATVDARVVAATNADLHTASDVGDFRADLLHRLEVFRITLPPLRERPEDLPLLAHAFLESVNSDFGLECAGINDDALAVLAAYQWPGNVRELKNVIAQAVVMAGSGPLKAHHLPPRVRQGDGAASPQSPSGVPGAEHTGSDSPEASNATGVFVPLGVPLEEVQRLYVLQTLAQCQNNKTRAAKVLGVSRKTLYDRLARWQDSAE